MGSFTDPEVATATGFRRFTSILKVRGGGFQRTVTWAVVSLGRDASHELAGGRSFRHRVTTRIVKNISPPTVEPTLSLPEAKFEDLC